MHAILDNIMPYLHTGATKGFRLLMWPSSYM